MCRCPMSGQFAEKESRFVSNSECITQELREWCCSQDSCRTRFMLSVLKCLKNEIDSAKSMGLMEIGVTCEEPSVLELDEYIAGSASLECAAALHPDRVVHWTNIGSRRQCATRLKNGSVASARPSVLPKNNARLVVMMLEVLAFPVDTNDVANGLETMERKIKEFERHANIDIPEFLKVGIVIRQTEEGPMRTHLIMNAHRLTAFPDIKAEVTNVEQAQRAVVTKVWTRSRRDRPKELPKVLETAKSLRSCAGTAKRKATERQSAARDTKVSARENRQVRRKAMATVLEKARNGSKDKCFGRREVGAHVERLQVLGDECVRGGRG